MYAAISQLGNYEILGKVASGGMATVYRARLCGTEGFSKIVALKVMHPHLSDDEHHKTMFSDESRLCARFNHPNLVSVFDHGTLDAYAFMAMEYHSGLTLSKLWKHRQNDGQPTSVAETLHILCHVLRGLEYAHNLKDESGKPLGIVHRDISPENVVLTEQGVVKVLDFGIALDNARRAVSKTGIVKGKIAYMSPEQLTGKVVDRRTDIYSIAVMAYELLTGSYLFSGGSTEEVRAKVLSRKKRPFKKGSLPIPALESVLLKALSFDPEDRYSTAEQFRQEFDRILTDKKWSISEESLGSAVKEARAAIDAKAKAKKKQEQRKQAERAQRQPQKAKTLGVQTFARVAVLLLGLSLLLELFGVRVPLAPAGSPHEDVQEEAQLESQLNEEASGPQIEPTVTQNP